MMTNHGRAVGGARLAVVFTLALILDPLLLPAQYAASRAGLDGWRVVVNNAVSVPNDGRAFNSYNQPSVNADGTVVFRARSKGGGGSEPAHGVFVRDMALETPLTTLFARGGAVPDPNNLGTTFVEPPSFPRIDVWSPTAVSRGNHSPVWSWQDGVTETRAGTTGIYTNPFAQLITGASTLGAVTGFEFLAVPGAPAGTKFDVFPGAPAVTDTATIVFKGNYSIADPQNPAVTLSRTGVYYRDLANAAAGGTGRVLLIADQNTLIPGTSTRFGSTAPPSAVGRAAVFAGFDNEDHPANGGIYLAPLVGEAPALTTLVRIGERVPGERSDVVFNKLGEGVSFDGRFVGFWGAWGTDATTLILQCPDEGNKDRLAYCRQRYPGGFVTTVPVHQGMFVHDIRTGRTVAVAKSPDDFSNFVYWNFSGLVPGMMGHADETGEPARWRAAAFVAVSGGVDGGLNDAGFHAAFKARTGRVVAGSYVDAIDGVYLRRQPGNASIVTVVQSGMDGASIDPAAINPLTHEPLPVTEMGLERDGFRGRWLCISVAMGTEEAGWAGIYLTSVPER